MGQKAWELKVDTLITVGIGPGLLLKGRKRYAGKNIYYYRSTTLPGLIRQVWNKKSTIVFKASRAMELEKLVDKT